MKSDYIQQNDDAFNAQLQTFKNGVGNYAAVIGVTAAQIAGQAADALYFDTPSSAIKLWPTPPCNGRAGKTSPAPAALRP